jgi:hypothetical protein
MLAIGMASIAAACSTADGEAATTSAPTLAAAETTTTQHLATTTTEATSTEAMVTPAEAIAVANAWYVAINADDIAAVMALFDADATVSNNFTGSLTLEEAREVDIWNAAQGTRLTTVGCASGDESAPTQNVRCEGANHDALVQAVGAPPVPANVTMTIGPNGITKLSYSYGNPNFNHVAGPFDEWMTAHYPEAVNDVGFGSWETPEEAEASGTLTAEFAAEWATYLEANDCTYLDGC